MDLLRLSMSCIACCNRTTLQYTNARRHLKCHHHHLSIPTLDRTESSRSYLLVCVFVLNISYSVNRCGCNGLLIRRGDALKEFSPIPQMVAGSTYPSDRLGCFLQVLVGTKMQRLSDKIVRYQTALTNLDSLSKEAETLNEEKQSAIDDLQKSVDELATVTAALDHETEVRCLRENARDGQHVYESSHLDQTRASDWTTGV